MKKNVRCCCGGSALTTYIATSFRPEAESACLALLQCNHQGSSQEKGDHTGVIEHGVRGGHHRGDSREMEEAGGRLEERLVLVSSRDGRNRCVYHLCDNTGL